MKEAMIQCSPATRLLVRADAQSEGVNMPILTDKYIQAGRNFYKKTCKQASKNRKRKQEVANV